MVTIRNANMCDARTVVATAGLKTGMVVKLTQGTAKGEPCQVAIPSVADLADATLVKGIVTYVQDNDLAVEFILNPANEVLTLNTGVDEVLNIPTGAVCVFWMNAPVVGLHPAVLDASIVMGTIREGAKVACTAGSGLIGLYTGAGNFASYLGTVYQHEGAELTIICNAI
jgi:hypothetical protein